jgi:hypothetical protein
MNCQRNIRDKAVIMFRECLEIVPEWDCLKCPRISECTTRITILLMRLKEALNADTTDSRQTDTNRQ